MVSVCLTEPWDKDFLKMTTLQAMWSVIRVPAVIFKGVLRLCATFGMFVHVILAAASVVVRPYMFAASLVTRVFRACSNAWNWAISTAKKFVKMVILLVSVAILVLVMTYLYYVKPHINHER
jgi:hypothetical protein